MCELAWENKSHERTIYVKTQQDIFYLLPLPFPPSFLYLFSLIPDSNEEASGRARVNGSRMMNDWGFARGPVLRRSDIYNQGGWTPCQLKVLLRPDPYTQ
jgi:hypothetical protein